MRTMQAPTAEELILYYQNKLCSICVNKDCMRGIYLREYRDIQILKCNEYIRNYNSE